MRKSKISIVQKLGTIDKFLKYKNKKLLKKLLNFLEKFFDAFLNFYFQKDAKRNLGN